MYNAAYCNANNQTNKLLLFVFYTLVYASIASSLLHCATVKKIIIIQINVINENYKGKLLIYI